MRHLFFSIISLLVFFILTFSCKEKNSSSGYSIIAPKVQTFKMEQPNKIFQEEIPLAFDNTFILVGTCKKDTTIYLTYPFVNKTNNKTEIKKVEGSCRCMILDYKRGEILPGEISSINVRYSSGNIEGFFKKEIYVYLKSGQKITLTFHVSVD